MIYNWFTICWPFLAILQPRKWRTPRRSSPRCTAEVSLPPQLGGFQMAITTSRLCVQLGRPRMTPSVFFSIFWMNMLWWEKKTAWNICSLWFFFLDSMFFGLFWWRKSWCFTMQKPVWFDGYDEKHEKHAFNGISLGFKLNRYYRLQNTATNTI